MPVEIRELQIITVVKDDGGNKTSAAPKKSGGTDDIIATCVEQVLEILKQKNER